MLKWLLHRYTRGFASRVFRYAVATARAKGDPAALLLGAIAAPQPKHLAAIIDPKRAGELLRAIAAYTGQPLTRDWGSPSRRMCLFGRASCGRPNGRKSTSKPRFGAYRLNA